MTAVDRGHWGSKLGFVLAAAGSAVGLGNIWKFPYITGENGGGIFVLIYLACIALVGLPVMMAEIFIGRTAQCSPVGAFRALSRPGSPWIIIGGFGVVAGFVILSYYSVVAGWALHYVYLSATGTFQSLDAGGIGALFGSVFANPTINLGWHAVFMVLTVAIVMAGVRGGVERWARILMPLLFAMMVLLLFRAMTTPGFGTAIEFLFAPHTERLTAAGVLEALGHAFFTLSLGMGAMITYGSYLQREDDLVATSVTVGVLDTVIAVLACMVLFPIIFSYGMEAAAGPGLVFVSLPIAFSQMTGGVIWATVFFVLLTFAALTSAISLLEVTASVLIDEKGWSRARAVVTCGTIIFVVGIPSALSGTEGNFFNTGMVDLTANIFGEGNGKNWFDTFDYLASNWLLPLGGLGIALFTAWRVGGAAREQGFKTGSRWGRLYWGWLFLLRWIVPIGVTLVFLHSISVI